MTKCEKIQIMIDKCTENALKAKSKNDENMFRFWTNTRTGLEAKRASMSVKELGGMV